MTVKMSIEDLSDSMYAGARVLVRTDFNVPLNPDGSIANDARIRETLPTLKYLLNRQARVIIVTHLGRPKGQVDTTLRLGPVVDNLRALLPNVAVQYVEESVGAKATEAVNALKPGEILVLENIRFEPGETKNDPELAKKLAEMTDIYVNDAFGAAHRAHASTEGVAHFVPNKVAGLLMQRELYALTVLLREPEKPFTAIVGGSKVSTKIDVLSRLLKQVNNLVIGGGMVFTFLKAKGYPVGNSMVEEEHIETARQLMKEAEATDRIIVLPKDILVADRFMPDAKRQVVPVSQIPDGWMGLDLGPESIERIVDVVKNSKTVFWNGPLGVFEFPAFAKATQEASACIATQTRNGFITSILGGGDTLAAIEKFGLPYEAFTHVSTGGGAMLEMMEGKELPGVTVLDDKTVCVTGA